MARQLKLSQNKTRRVSYHAIEFFYDALSEWHQGYEILTPVKPRTIVYRFKGFSETQIQEWRKQTLKRLRKQKKLGSVLLFLNNELKETL